MSVPSIDISILSWTVPFSVLLSSVIGSPHCIAMCGPLAMNFASRGKSRLLAYHLGRGATYVTAGALAGATGRQALHSASAPWLASVSLALIAIILIATGLRAFTGRSLHFPIPSALRSVFQKTSSRLNSALWRGLLRQTNKGPLPSGISAFFGGAATIFLPCGHLYAFVVGAMATGSAINGAVFMLLFWLGTLPALVFGASWLHRMFQRTVSQRSPRVGAALLIFAGLVSLASFATQIPALTAQASSTSQGHVHSEHKAPTFRCH